MATGTIREENLSLSLFLSYSFSLTSLSVSLTSQSGINKSTEWSTIPACPSLMCFFNRGGAEGTDSSKFCLFDVCVYCVNLCQDRFGCFWRICGLMTCVQNEWETD